ncbi:hypothetical protein PHYPSEUDO_000364 [Phytophthora pseudosyringae]|uniref:RxLR effector protein n=1 Tax=Phytophthora pseudosyringae TaxID=221518 RepID=A0A8T1W2P3_9STRA|nr:hypothetical protein PHYPSEUDO_000364 [Phytophthora pseudosyringae]
MRFFWSVLPAIVWVGALLVAAPTVESHYRHESAPGSHGGDHDAGIVQHLDRMNPPPHPGHPHGRHGPVGLPHGKHLEDRLKSAGPDDLALVPSGYQGNRQLRRDGKP